MMPAGARRRGWGRPRCWRVRGRHTETSVVDEQAMAQDSPGERLAAFRGWLGYVSVFTTDQYRHERRLKRLLKAARFRYPAAIEEVDFALRRNLD